MPEYPLLIIGGGQSGLATARAANRRGLRPLLLDAAEDAGGSWPHYYDSLALFSPARFSALPGRALGGDGDRYPRRDEIVDYLRDYATHLDADIRHGHRVTRIQAEHGAFTAITDDGGSFAARAVVAATGGFSRPYRPVLPGLADFTGTVLHTADYRRPCPFAGQRVVIVGAGNSAVQIATELADTARVTLASRSPIAWANARPLGRDIHWWFVRTGLDSAPLRKIWLKGPVLVNDDGRHRAAFATGNPDRRAMFTRLEDGKVEWSDGTRESIDTLILATGYRPALDYLHGTGALDDGGAPLHTGGVSTTVPGLGYVGLEFQRSFSSATLRGAGRDAAHVIRHLRAGRTWR